MTATGPPRFAGKPRLRGVSHRYAFFVSVVLAVVVVAKGHGPVGPVGAAG
jgi:hypothetical protein